MGMESAALLVMVAASLLLPHHCVVSLPRFSHISADYSDRNVASALLALWDTI